MKRYVKFNQDGVVNGQQEFVKGKVYEFTNEASATRWLNRGNDEVSEKEFKSQGKEEVKPVAPPPPPANPPKDKDEDADEEAGL